MFFHSQISYYTYYSYIMAEQQDTSKNYPKGLSHLHSSVNFLQFNFPYDNYLF